MLLYTYTLIPQSYSEGTDGAISAKNRELPAPASMDAWNEMSELAFMYLLNLASWMIF